MKLLVYYWYYSIGFFKALLLFLFFASIVFIPLAFYLMDNDILGFDDPIWTAVQRAYSVCDEINIKRYLKSIEKADRKKEEKK